MKDNANRMNKAKECILQLGDSDSDVELYNKMDEKEKARVETWKPV